MIIITADDFGRNREATDHILACYAEKRITSASAMVFMKDSERAAALALAAGIEVGLHVNFTLTFDGETADAAMHGHHARVAACLGRSRLSPALYHPRLADSFGLLFEAQESEFRRLYGRAPVFYNGHHHMHLCTDVLVGKLLPKGAAVRRTFTFSVGEKGLLNLVYRRLLDAAVVRRHVSTDSFFSILPLEDIARLKGIFGRGSQSRVEIEVHPENALERDFLLSGPFLELMSSAPAGRFAELSSEGR